MGAVAYPDEKVAKFVDYNFVPVQIEISNTALVQQFQVNWIVLHLNLTQPPD